MSAPRATLISSGLRFIFSKAATVEEPAAPGVQVTVQADDVRAREQLIEAHGLGTEPARHRGVHARIRGENLQAKAERPVANGLPDAAEADDAERLAGEAAQSLYLVPAPAVSVLHLAVIREQAAIQREQQCERMVRDLVRAVFADARDANAALRSRLRRPRNPSQSRRPR